MSGISGIAHTANLPTHIAERMIRRAIARLDRFAPAHLEHRLLGPDRAVGPGGAIVVRAHCGGALLGASAVARRGVPAERVADEAASSLAADLDAGATVDVHASDQLPVYLARAAGDSEFLVSRHSTHAETIHWLLARFLPVRREIDSVAGGAFRVRVIPG